MTVYSEGDPNEKAFRRRIERDINALHEKVDKLIETLEVRQATRVVNTVKMPELTEEQLDAVAEGFRRAMARSVHVR